MLSRAGWFVLGIIATIIGIVVFVIVFVESGGVSMETTAKPLPFEATLAHMALHASFGDAAAQKNPLPPSDANMLAGAEVYRDHCAGCHGLPAHNSGLARRMFPPPPQLFVSSEMVTDDPQGITYWKITHGIRLSGMPGFASVLTPEQRWQVAMLLANADKLSPSVAAALQPQPARSRVGQ